jgi:type II secretory pathway component PulF
MFQEFALSFDSESPGSASGVHSSFIRWLSSPHVFTAAWKIALLLIVVVVVIRLASGALFARLVRILPLVGPLVHYRAQTEFASLLGLLLNQRIPLPQALQLTAEGVQNQAMRQACLVAAEKVAHGQNLSQCMAASPDFAMSLVPIVQWGERLSSLAEALASAATLSRERIELQASLLGRVLPAFMFVVIATLTVASYQMLVLPMVKMITDLS